MKRHNLNRFLDRVEVRDKSGQEPSYLKKNRFLDRIDIFQSTDGRRTGEVLHNRFLDRGEVTIEEVKWGQSVSGVRARLLTDLSNV